MTNNADGFSDIPELRNLSGGFNAYWRPTATSKLTARYNIVSDKHRGGNRLDLQPHEANISEGAEHLIHSAQLDYHAHFGHHCFEGYAAVQHTNRESYYGGIGEGSAEEMEEALKAYGYTGNLTAMGGLRYTYSFNKFLFMPAELTAGVEYNYDRLIDSIPGYNSIVSQQVHILGGYLQNEWKNKSLSLLLGLRVDKHTLIKKPIFSPRVSIRYSVIEPLTLRVGYASGFRAPQTYDEDLHVALSGGERIVSRLSDSLREERSHNFTLSLNYDQHFGKVRFKAEAEGFFTYLNHIFAIRNYTDNDGFEWAERYNADKGYVYGAHAEIQTQWDRWIDATVGITFQKSEYDKPVEWSEDAECEKRMLKTPNVYGHFILASTPWRTLNIAFSGNLTGKMLVPHETDIPVLVSTPTFFELNFRLSYDFRLRSQKSKGEGFTENAFVLQLYAGVQNITNSYQKDLDFGVNRDSAYIYGPLTPRCFFAGVKLSL